MNEALGELAACFRAKTRLPDEELARLTLAARAADSRWDDIAAACGISTCKDLAGVVYRITGETGAELLFSATQEAVRQLTGSERRYPPLTWACAGCGQQVTDRAPAGRPVHVEHGHGPGGHRGGECGRASRDGAGRPPGWCLLRDGQAGQGALPGGDALAGQHADAERERLRACVQCSMTQLLVAGVQPAAGGGDLAGIRAGARVSSRVAR